MTNVAVLGASGIGKFHAREFKNAGYNVIAFLGQKEDSCVKTKQILEKNFNILAKPYTDITQLIESENLDFVSICTPPNLHEEQVKICLNSGINVLCEKPIIFERNCLEKVKNLFKLAEEKNKVLSVNTQWVSISELLRSNLNQEINEFSMKMQLGVKGPLNLIKEGISHTNSMVISLFGLRDTGEIFFEEKSENLVVISFLYNNKKIKYILEYKLERPRDLEFELNGESFSRIIGENYEQFIFHNEKRIKIGDPFKVSIESFTNRNPLVSKEEVLANIQIQDKILEAFYK